MGKVVVLKRDLYNPRGPCVNRILPEITEGDSTDLRMRRIQKWNKALLP